MKGPEREKQLLKSDYYSDAYFSMRQLCTLSHQINEISKLKPKSILEIGIGNGFVSSFLKRSGIDVCTVDINSELEPDIVSSIEDLPLHLEQRKFDLVVCCEVLEHIPFEEFEKSIKIFKGYSSRLFLTLPRYKTWFGVSGFMRLPRIDKIFSIGFDFNKKKDLNSGHCHFWEVDSSPETTTKNIKSLINKHYQITDNNSFHLNRYHEFLVCDEL